MNHLFYIHVKSVKTVNACIVKAKKKEKWNADYLEIMYQLR